MNDIKVCVWKYFHENCHRWKLAKWKLLVRKCFSLLRAITEIGKLPLDSFSLRPSSILFDFTPECIIFFYQISIWPIFLQFSLLFHRFSLSFVFLFALFSKILYNQLFFFYFTSIIKILSFSFEIEEFRIEWLKSVSGKVRLVGKWFLIGVKGLKQFTKIKCGLTYFPESWDSSRENLLSSQLIIIPL